MSIHIITGKPGAGKSLYGVHMVIKQLRETQRNVVTNLPIDLAKLNQYLNLKFPTENLCAVTRVRILTDDQIRSFWNYRGLSDEPKEIDGARGLSLGEAPHGVCYVLDEAHIAFNSRDWATLGRGAINYMSQHRKLGDIIFPITQAAGNLDKQFRSVAEDYTVMRNEYTAKFGPFRGAGRFVRRSYYGEPQRNSEPFETATFYIDKAGIAGCYDTAKGIGVHGSKADIGSRARGISIYWVFPIVMAIGSLCVFIPWWLGRAAGKYVSGPQEKLKVISQGVKPSVPAQPGEKAQDNKPKPKPPAITGYMVKGKQAIVVLQDGSVVLDEDGRLSAIRRGRVRLDDEWVTPTAKPRAAPIIFTNPSPVFDNKELAIPSGTVTLGEVKSSDGGTQPPTQKQNEQEKPNQDQNRAERVTGRKADPGTRDPAPGLNRPGSVHRPRQVTDPRATPVQHRTGGQVSGNRS